MSQSLGLSCVVRRGLPMRTDGNKVKILSALKSFLLSPRQFLVLSADSGEQIGGAILS